jgi:hypothetical protein
VISIVALVAFGSMLPKDSQDAAKEAARSEPPTNDRAKCDQVIDIAVKSGLVISRPSADRLNVNETIWENTLTDEKAVLMQMLICSAYGGRTLAQIEDLDTAVIYGAHSGKRLAMIGTFGIKYE